MPRRSLTQLTSAANSLLTDPGPDNDILPSQVRGLFIDIYDTLLDGVADDNVLRADGGSIGWGKVIGEMLSNGVQNGLLGTPTISGRTITFPVEGSRANPTLTLPGDNDTVPNAANVLAALGAMNTAQERTARGNINAYGIVFYGSIPNDAALGTLTTAVAQDNRSAMFIAGGSFTTTNANVQQDNRNVSANDVYMWGITAQDSTLRWRRVLSASVYARTGGGGGVSIEQVQDNLAGTVASPNTTGFIRAGTGIDLVYDDGANTLTIGTTGGTSPPQHSMTRYIGVSATTTITDAALTTGATSTSDTDDTFNTPTYTGSRYLFFGVPDSTGDITSVDQVGNPLGNIGVQRIAGTRNISGTDFKVWRTDDALSALFSNVEVRITQAS